MDEKALLEGENRCSQVDNSFPFLPPGWAVNVRNGQYRATQTDGTGLESTPGNEGWSGREGQLPGSSGIKVRLTPEVVRGDVRRWGADSDPTGLRAFPPLGSHSTKDRGQNEQKLLDHSAGVFGSGHPMVPSSPVEMDRGSGSVVTRARRHRRGMRPAGGVRPFPQRVKNGLTDEGGGGTKVMPLSVEAGAFSPRTVSKSRVTAGTGSDGSGDYLPSRTRAGKTVIRCDAVVPTTAVAGAEALADIAGRPCRNGCSGRCRNEILGRCRAHSSAVDDEGDPSVIRTCRQCIAVVFDPMAAPRKDCGPMGEMSVLEPLEHSVLDVSLEGGDRYIDEVAMPYPLEHSGVSRAADLVSEISAPKPLEHSVLEVPLEVGMVQSVV